MRDLFRFLYRIRNTLVFLLLLAFSLVLLANGNAHHRSAGHQFQQCHRGHHLCAGGRRSPTTPTSRR